ncbi:PREDICTED: putative uncharacterized protein ZNRD1-AS1 isoform X1 [Rhinopithecus bieti]|uniref:putative uncharacterized protein ZNRD1-AS1 isoform X1 n=1 Tax=Rhinopithecus bieti TaxID=61621 RepID=UPI00083C4A48|nr:PREDICTED: putative uncharacterized protein ZNRD1-AS1 isoform X1 [Rhinopithecus bieti]
MLYVLIEAERARIKKLQEEKTRNLESSRKLEPRIVSEHRGGLRTDIDVLGQHLTKEHVSSHSQSPIRDSQWFMLSPQEKLAWGTSSKDPRIAAGQQSPLEKKILNLGGVHTTAARQLITQKYQEECEILYREQAVSLDYWLAKAESYYNKLIVEMMKEETGNEIKKKMEKKTTRSIEGLKQYYLIPEREMKHIERHMHQAGQAGEFKNKSFRQVLRPFSEGKLPNIVPEGHGIQNAQRRKQVNEREQMQIKDHQERMIRGRELTEQRLKERILRRSQSQLPTYEKRERGKKEIKEFERVIAYPLFQPCSRSRIKVNILMEKSQNGEKGNTIVKPYQRKFLAMPPFLRSQIGKIKD